LPRTFVPPHAGQAVLDDWGSLLLPLKPALPDGVARTVPRRPPHGKKRFIPVCRSVATLKIASDTLGIERVENASHTMAKAANGNDGGNKVCKKPAKGYADMVVSCHETD